MELNGFTKRSANAGAMSEGGTGVNL